MGPGLRCLSSVARVWRASQVDPLIGLVLIGAAQAGLDSTVKILQEQSTKGNELIHDSANQDHSFLP